MAEKTIDIASPILSRNERLADQLRQRFKETNTYVINVLSSPGSGKTTTILGTNERLRDKAGLRCAEGSRHARHPDQHGWPVPPRGQHDHGGR